MGGFTIDMDLYFWLIDRANIPDDKKNQVLVDENQVILHRDLAQKLFNGIHIANLLMNIRKIVIKKSKKSFTLDPELYNLKDQNLTTTRISNWKILQIELKKFGVKINAEILEEVHDDNEETMEGIVQQLFKYDQTVNAYPDVVGPTGAIMNQKKPTSDVSLNAKNIDQMGTQVPYHKHSNKAASRKKASMDEDLDQVMGKGKKSLGQGVAMHDEFGDFQDKIDPGMGAQATSGIGSLERLQYIDNLPDFIYETLSISLKMTPNQAAALLTSNQKFLIHMCVKGMKGNDFSKIKAWYKLLISQTKEIIDLMERHVVDPKSIRNAFNVFKTGFFSHNQVVSEHTITFILKIYEEIGQRQPNVAKSLQKELYDWFVVTQSDLKDTSFKNVTGDIRDTWIKIPKAPKQLEKLITQPGMVSMLRCWFYHQDVILEKTALLMTTFGEHHALEIFTQHLRRHVQNNKDYLVFMHDHLVWFNSTALGKKILVEAFPFIRILTFALDLSTNDGGSLVERQASLSILVHAWRTRPDIVEKNEAMTKGIMDSLKAGCRDLKSSTLRTSSYYLLFSLLYDFSKEKQKFAPMVYNILTYMLIECYSFLEQREDLLKNFILVFQLNPQIPINIMCEPLFKQIQIYLEKDNNRLLEENKTSNSILMPDSELFNLNVTDFELFMTIATHKKTNVSLAVKLLEIACEVGRKHVMFTRVSLKLVLTILARFESQYEMQQAVANIVKQNLNVIYSQDLDKVSLYVRLKNQLPNAMRKDQDNSEVNKSSIARKASVTKAQLKGIQVPPQSNKIVQAEPIINLGVDGRIDDSIIKSVFNAKYFPEETNTYLNFKSYERMIVNLLQCVIHSGHQRIQDQIKEQLMVTFLRIEAKTKFRNRAIYYLMSLYGKDVETMLKQKKNKVAKTRLDRIQTMREENESDGRPSPRKSPTKIAGYLDTEPSVQGSPSRKTSKLKVTQSAQKTERETGKKKIRLNSNYYDLTGIPVTIGEVIQSENDLARPLRINKPPSPKARGVPRVERTRLFDIMLEPEETQEKYIEFVREYTKMYKGLFFNYASKSNNKYRNEKDSFDNIQSKVLNMQEIFKFLSDYRISFKEFESKNVIISMIKQINFKINGGQRTQQLDLEGFIEFCLQVAHKLFKKIVPTDVEAWLELFFDRLKIAGLTFNTPVTQRLFDNCREPRYTIDDKQMRDIALHQNMNPNFILPHMLTKVAVQKKNHPGLQAAQEVLQDILMENFGFEIYEARLAKQVYRVKYNNKEINREQTKLQFNDRLSYIKEVPGNGNRPFRPLGSGGSPDRNKKQLNMGFDDLESQKTIQPKKSMKKYSPTALSMDLKDFTTAPYSVSTKKSIKHVPENYVFQYDKPTVGGLARNSHGAKLLEDVGKRNANRIAQTLDEKDQMDEPGKYDGTKNKIMYLRQQAQDVKRMREARKEEKYQERADELRADLNQVKAWRESKTQDDRDKIQEMKQRKKDREANKQAEKEAYYEEVRAEHAQTRLPAIEAKQSRAAIKKEIRRTQKNENIKRVPGHNVQNLSTLFGQMTEVNKRKANASQRKEEKLKAAMERERLDQNIQPKWPEGKRPVAEEMNANKDFARGRSKSVAKITNRLDGNKSLTKNDDGRLEVKPTGGFKAGLSNSRSPGKRSGKFAPNNLSHKQREINLQNSFTPASQAPKKKGFLGLF